MKKEDILKKFNETNPKLIHLKPEIRITETLEEVSTENDDLIIYDPPLLEIEVRHPFIFDIRLIPTDFKGICVKDITTGKYPKEFPSGNAALPLEDWYAPERYVKFVESNLSLISRKIKIPDLTKSEALNALTGNFEKHINWCTKLRAERIKKEKENIAFFTELLYSVKQSYLISDVYNKFKDKEWYYSISSTRLSKNKPLILGFNWGVDSKMEKSGIKHNPQSEYPFAYFEGLYDELGSFKRVVTLFHEYFPKALVGTQTNFCFFRTENESQLTHRDIELCIPIFEKLLDYLNPSCIISFSRPLHNYLLLNKENKVDTIKIPSGKKTVFATKGIITINNTKIKYYNLPHPNNYRFHHEFEPIEKAWEYCFKNE